MLPDPMPMEYRQGTLYLGDVSAADLLREYGSPLYVYEAAILERQLDRLTSGLSALPVKPFYAMKANSNLELLRRIAARSFGCDAVSPGEVDLARKAGFDPSDIWFTCSNVSDQDLLSLEDEQITINVNSMSELDRFMRLRLRNPLALRINPDVGAGHHRDVVTGGFGVKFGFDLAELETARILAEDNGTPVKGLHAHIGSGITEIEPLIQSASALLETAAAFDKLELLNFGGGLAVPYRPGEPEMDVAAYGAALSEVVTPFVTRRRMKVILEPGRYVTAQCGTLLTTVTAKKISGGHTWLGCDTGFNHLARPSRYGSYHHILNASRGDDGWLRETYSGPIHDDDEGLIVAGNLCESGDVFTRDGDEMRPRHLPPTSVGDILAICDAGAYGFSMASHYNARLLPAEVVIDGARTLLTRRRQSMESLVADQMP